MPNTPTKMSAWDVTPGFVAAIQTWSEFLKGDRSNTEWGVAGAKYLLVAQGINLPTTPISTQDLIVLRALAQEAGRMNGPNATVKRSTMARANNATAQVNNWLADNCNITLDTGTAPTKQSDTSLTDAMSAAHNVYADPASELAGFTTNQTAATNNYDVVDASLNPSSLAQNEYDIVDALTDGQLDANYWTPPAPEAKLLQDAGI